MINYIVVVGIVLFIFERVRPLKAFVSTPYWYTRAILLNLLILPVVILGAVTWDTLFQTQSIFSIKKSLPEPVQGLLIYLLFHFLFYWWHRFKHQNDFLWRIFHQVHHSIQRIEVLSSNYLHPLDVASGLTLGSFVAYFVLGASLEGMAWFTFYLGSMGYFLHSNIKVPRWLGYIIQTPQMHRRHHEYGKHDSNYCDIVWFDMMFGTYENPVEACERCGFDTNKEIRIKDMLLFRDVNK